MPPAMPPTPSGNPRPQNRIIILGAVFFLIFLGYTVKLFSMQILTGEQYRIRALNISKRVTVIPPQRGEIYDRNFDQPIVMNTDSFAVLITPAEVPNDEMPELIGKVADIVGIPREQIERKIPPKYYYLYQPQEVASNVSFETISALAERGNSLPGVSWQLKPMRNYVDTRSLAHITGYVGNITSDELTVLYNQGYNQGDIIGKAGIEREYDELLRGKEGRETRTVDVRGRRVAGEQVARETPFMGKNLVLTIDRKIQTLAEQAMGNRMGAAVVMRPTTGEILAMVSYPWYDPNIFNHSDMGNQYATLINDPNKPFLNRAIQSSYPPASTFKIIMTTGILAEKVFSPEQEVLCQGEVTYGDRLWRCHVLKPGHGRLKLQQALAQSCDIYYWFVGREAMGVDRITTYAREYGLGEETNIDLPGEIAGFVPNPQWKERNFHEKWLGGDTMNMSIGQGYTLVTPLQMANVVAMVANGGTVYEPHLLKEIRDPATGEVESSVEPKILHKTSTSPAILKTVAEDMRTVVTQGSLRWVYNLLGVSVAAKTGTAEIGLSDHWHSWLVAYGPYETAKPDDRIVVAVIVEATNTWEWWATYTTGIIYQGIFGNQSYEDAVQTLGWQHLIPTLGRRE
jgi:penicillin-binding protein 2